MIIGGSKDTYSIFTYTMHDCGAGLYFGTRSGSITKASFEGQASGWDVSVALDNRHGARKNLSQENEQ